MTRDSKDCRFAGGNDYCACMDCGIEYDYRRQPRPPCGAEERRAKLIQEKRRIEDQLERLR